MEPNIVITDIKTVLELKEKLSIYVNAEIQDFILKTGICPKITVVSIEMPVKLSKPYKTIELEFKLEL